MSKGGVPKIEVSGPSALYVVAWIIFAAFSLVGCIFLFAALDDKCPQCPKIKRIYTLPERPDCIRWHVVKPKQTQWELAEQMEGKYPDKKQWIVSMRWLSGKDPEDVNLRPGEWVCLDWRSADNVKR